MEAIKDLSLERKRELLRLYMEKERVIASKKLENYRPHSGAWRNAPNDGQEAFHKSNASIRVALGGNQSGKTIAGAVEFIWRMLGCHPYTKDLVVPQRGRIIASLGFEEGANQVIIPKILEWLPEGLVRRTRNNATGIKTHWELSNGSVFDILSGEQEAGVFEGWTGHVVWADEPPPRYAFTASLRGIMRHKGHIYLTLTPLTEPWVYNDLYMPWSDGTRRDIQVFTFDIMDNAEKNGGVLSEEAIASFCASLTMEEREARLRGKFQHLSGRVYPEFDKNLHVVESFTVPASWPVYGGIDPHLRREHAYCQWTVHPSTGDIIVCGEIYEKYTIPELAEAILKLSKGKNIIRTLIDNAAETPDSLYRVTPRRLLEQNGVYTKLCDKSAGIAHGIHAMKALLRPTPMADGALRPKFFVMDHCHNHIKEFMNYVHDTRDTEYMIKDTPRKIYDHFMDLDRYFVTEIAPAQKVFQNDDSGPTKFNTFRYGRG